MYLWRIKHFFFSITRQEVRKIRGFDFNCARSCDRMWRHSHSGDKLLTVGGQNTSPRRNQLNLGDFSYPP